MRNHPRRKPPVLRRRRLNWVAATGKTIFPLSLLRCSRHRGTGCNFLFNYKRARIQDAPRYAGSDLFWELEKVPIPAIKLMELIGAVFFRSGQFPAYWEKVHLTVQDAYFVLLIWGTAASELKWFVSAVVLCNDFSPQSYYSDVGILPPLRVLVV